MNEIYPLTIVRDRYMGSYSDGKYTAWNLESWEVPRAIAGDDIECMGFWWQCNAYGITVGRGNTPEEAVEDLRKRMDE